LEIAQALPKIQDATHLRRWVHRVSFHVALNVRKKERTAWTTSAESRTVLRIVQSPEEQQA